MNQEKKMGYIVILLILILIFGGLLLFLNQPYNKMVYTYKGPGGEYTFRIMKDNEITSHVVAAYVGNNEYFYPLRYGPKELEDLPMEEDLKDKILKDVIYITQDPKLPEKTNQISGLAVVEFNRVTHITEYSIFKIPTITGVTRETERSKENGLPLITCNNITDTIAVLWFKKGTENRIYSENGCIILEAEDDQGFYKVADKLLLYLIGVF